MTLWRLYYEKRGMHVHCRLFCGADEGALGQCGRLTFKVPEFRELHRHFIIYRELVDALERQESVPAELLAALTALKANMYEIDFRREVTVDDKPAGDDDALEEKEVVDGPAIYQSFEPPTEEWAEKVCKVGYGAECCRYLVRGPHWSCRKNTPERGFFDARVACGQSVARGDNCIGRGA